ncbi:hypothetical protein DFS34DRAFT_409278 [Phlyctochytrium arcticum]|nr:hypothetical protein DFS34DRAFT_409278 [Phlyctochytrium arcticum]
MSSGFANDNSATDVSVPEPVHSSEQCVHTTSESSVASVASGGLQQNENGTPQKRKMSAKQKAALDAAREKRTARLRMLSEEKKIEDEKKRLEEAKKLLDAEKEKKRLEREAKKKHARAPTRQAEPPKKPIRTPRVRDDEPAAILPKSAPNQTYVEFDTLEENSNVN